MKMDHHCPWINNCLGQNNHKFFIQFLLMVCLSSIHSLGMAGANLWWCYTGHPCEKPSPQRIIMVAVAVVLAVFFAIFVIAMMCDQYEALATDTTGIEAMKKWDLSNRDIVQSLSVVCGEEPSIGWVLPTLMPAETAFDHSKWKPTDYDKWDPRDPTVTDHYDKVKGYDWIDDATQLRYSANTILDQLNQDIPKGIKSGYFVGKDGYPELRVYPGEERFFPELAPEKPTSAAPPAAASNGHSESVEEIAATGCKRPEPSEVRQRATPHAELD
jgi:hypothetical protein